MSTAPQTRSGPGILLGTTAIAVLAGVGAALAFGLAEGIMASRTPAASTAGTLLFSLCLYAPVGLATGLLWGPIHGGLAAALPGIRRRLRDEEDLDRQVAAGILAAALALLLEVLIVQSFVTLAANGMSNRHLAALSTGLVAAAGVLVCAAAFFPLFVLLKGVTRFIPRVGSATATTVGGLLLALAGAGALILGRVDWRVLRFGPWITLAALAVVTALLTLALKSRLGGKAVVALGLVALLASLGLTLAAPTVGQDEQSVTPAQDGVLLPLLVSTGRGLKDDDGDGYSPWFNGGDCDDSNAGINPAERDVPGNGVDENCLGGDARLKKVVTRKVRPPAAKPKRPAFTGNVLLLCIDTLRADKLGVLGNPDGLTPNLDRLASQGTLFSGAFAQGPNTPQSFPSIFTSQYPSRIPFRRRFTNYPALKPEAVTVFEVLRDNGFTTAAVTSHFYFKDRRGITQGIKDWDNRGATDIKGSNKDIASPRIVPRAVAKLKSLAAAKKRFALFVHLFEPHSTYVRHRQFPITKKGVKGLKQKYDFEVKFVDLWVGKLLAGLKEAGLDDNTAIIVFSDHGESFGEHKLYFHGQALYNEVINVPLMVRLPGGKKRVVKDRVALLDIAPTMLELMGIPAPQTFQGRSLLPAVHGERSSTKRRIGSLLMRYPSWPKGWRAMISGDYKVLHRVTENRLEIYDLAVDPGEKTNLALSDRALAKKLRLELTRFAEEEL